MSPGPRSPYDGTTRLIVDGTNLLYRIGRGGQAAPPAAVIGRLRAAVPAAIAIDLVFDGVGHGVFGRLAQGMFVRYSGRRTADDVILDLASEAAMEAGGPAGADTVLVITNDRELQHRLVNKGSRTAPLQWLINRMDLPVLAAPAAGNKRPPIGAGSPPPGGGGPNPAGRDDDTDRPRWKPGRRATVKTGTPHKVARHKRHPRMPG
jgi:hypothetical protein